ncbi:hypothetical protein [Streptomyces flaveolus]|jgi:hypothetical protein|uniref:hypothetical protein n=1 Tax=Streptomyces flaveolus TaxID=67297 RepID=UPI00166F8DA3|nr:hypothetical protein [Streptomyces flaveolus]GGQ58270.1 hypothetical protein GCM10010216_20190 [Streptomyces flaveolus]
MKQKITSLAGAMAMAGGVVITTVAAATGQATEVDHGRPAFSPAPHATVAFGDHLSDSDLTAPLSELAAGRRTPRA